MRNLEDRRETVVARLILMSPGGGKPSGDERLYQQLCRTMEALATRAWEGR